MEKDISKHTCAIGERNIFEMSTGERMRRSLTIAPENDKKLLLVKGTFLTGDTPFDMDYTTLVNIFIELGHKIFYLAKENGNSLQVTLEKNDIVNIFKKYFLSPELKEDAIGDQFIELFLFKKLTEQSQKTETELSKQKPAPELPAPKSSSSNTKVPEYVS
jgi:hypothetical protein